MYAQTGRFNVQRCEVTAMKKIFVLTSLILMLFVSSCSAAKSSPTEDISTICEAFLHFDEASMNKLGMNPTEYKKNCIGAFSKSFISSSGINFSENQISEINNVIIGLLQRTQFNVKIVEQNDDSANLKITLSKFEKLDENLIKAHIPSNLDFSLMSQEEKNDIIVNVIIATLKELKIDGNFEFVSQCQYIENEKMWLPVQAENFARSLFSGILIFD